LFNLNLELNFSSKKLLIPSIIGLILIITLPSLAIADPQYPATGTATVDGDPEEWNLVNDFFANMYRAGVDTKEIESKLYLRYDLPSETMYVLVLTQPGVPALTLNDDAWVAIDGINNKKVTGASGNASNGEADGFEASFKISPNGEPRNLMVHVQVYNDCEAQTSKTIKIGLELFVVPETLIATTLISTLAAGGVFLAYKKHKTPTQPKAIKL